MTSISRSTLGHVILKQPSMSKAMGPCYNLKTVKHGENQSDGNPLKLTQTDVKFV